MSKPPEEGQKETEKTEKAEEPAKRKKKGKKAFSFYKIETNRIQRLRPTCERCGPGYFMADHSDRFTCGRCGFTRYKTAEK